MAKTKAAQGPKVKVRVAGGPNPKNPKEIDGQPLLEDGVSYQPGQEFVTTAERAEALGESVVILGPVEAPKTTEAPKTNEEAPKA